MCHLCLTLGNRECRSGGFIDAHMSRSNEILAPLVTGEDVAVRLREMQNQAEERWPPRLGRQRQIAKCVFRTCGEVVRWWDHSMELGRTPRYNKYKESCSKHDYKIPNTTSNRERTNKNAENQYWNVKFAVWSFGPLISRVLT